MSVVSRINVVLAAGKAVAIPNVKSENVRVSEMLIFASIAGTIHAGMSQDLAKYIPHLSKTVDG
ncbi:MAG: hypothetical protein WAK60_03905 [Sedimentisphaerales bacterium]